MKKQIFLIMLFIISGITVFPQVAVNTAGTEADPSAMLDVSSTVKGFLPPRVNSVSDISSPAEGLMVFQTTAPAGYYYYDGSSWKALSDGNSDFWRISGNQGLSATTNFIGTTDNVPLNFRVNNAPSGRIDADKKNTFFGYYCGDNNTDGSENTAMGTYTLRYVDSSYNTAIGYYSMYYNTKGDYNTATGYYSLLYNTYGSNNIALGANSLNVNKYSCYNIAIGNKALYFNSYTNNNHTFEGHNVAMGYYALYYLNPQSKYNGIRNTCAGRKSMFSASTAKYNTACGYMSLYDIRNGSENTVFGGEALYNNDTGSYNVAIGYRALYDNTTGNGNTAIGSYAGKGNETGDYNTFIGYNTTLNNADRYNCIVMGGNGNLIPSGDNSIRVGDAAFTSIKGNVAWTALSDERFKEDISPMKNALQFIMSLEPVTYNIDIETENRLMGMKTVDNKAALQAGSILHTGLTAQNVDEAARKTDWNSDIVDKPDEKGGLMGIRYGLLTVPLTAAVQEQQKIIQRQNETINRMQQELKKLEILRKEVDQLEKLLNNR